MYVSLSSERERERGCVQTSHSWLLEEDLYGHIDGRLTTDTRMGMQAHCRLRWTPHHRAPGTQSLPLHNGLQPARARLSCESFESASHP